MSFSISSKLESIEFNFDSIHENFRGLKEKTPILGPLLLGPIHVAFSVVQMIGGILAAVASAAVASLCISQEEAFDAFKAGLEMVCHGGVAAVLVTVNTVCLGLL